MKPISVLNGQWPYHRSDSNQGSEYIVIFLFFISGVWGHDWSALGEELLFYLNQYLDINMSHFSYSCKMRCPLYLVLENWEYLWFYLTFWIAILDCGLKLHKLSIHTLVMLQKEIEIHKIIVWSFHGILFSVNICYRKI